jgi:hypothetical protein
MKIHAATAMYNDFTYANEDIVRTVELPLNLS